MVVSLKRRSGFADFCYWIWDGLERTVLIGTKFSFPARFVSPFGFLGMLTFVMFIILGVTGALLMFYYEPILDRAWDSVAKINNTVPYGFMMRNIHYHASNAMVLLAVLHMYYQYFSGRYKIRNEIIWVVGVVLGTVTILEAFTGYDIIFSERAELAISIATSLTNSMPVVGPTIRDAMFGSGFADFILRFYTLHVFILPVVMLGLMAVHMPRFMVFDVPMVMAFSGAVLITGGVFPVDLGSKFQPTVPPGITVPEWYLTGIYAFLRTQYDKFVTGVLWPGVFIVALAMTPFIDRYKKFSWKDRPLVTAFGITGITQVMVTTYWGFYITPDVTKPLVARLVIDPIFFYIIMLLLVPIGFGFSYMMILLAKEAERKAKLAASKGPHRTAQINFSGKWINWLIIALLIFQVYINIAAYNAVLAGMKNFSLFLVGLGLMVFAGLFHLYRLGLNEAKKAPAPPPQQQAEPTKSLGGPELQGKVPPKEESVKPPPSQPSAVAPEIKAANLENLKDPVIGKSDLKNP